MNLATKLPKWIWPEKEVTLKEIMSLHQADLEVSESSNERCQTKAHQSQSQPQQNQWSNKDKQEKYKQWKVRTKGILDVWQTQRLMNKRQARK